MPIVRCLPDSCSIEMSESDTILDALVAEEIPHTHVCGGNAYCSTCRVMILEGNQHCSPPTSVEKALAKKLDFPVHIRLACQTRISGDVSIRRLVLNDEDIDIVDSQMSVGFIGRQRSVGILSARIRGTTNFDEANFPYDIIYVMSRYFHRMDKVIGEYGGVINNYTGWRLMALFGTEDDDRVPERSVWAGLEMLKALQELNSDLSKLSYNPLNLSIGVHYGTAIILPVSCSAGMQRITALGRAIEVVGRVESANRKLGSELLVSNSIYKRLPQPPVIHRHGEIDVTKKGTKYPVFEVIQMVGDPPEKPEKTTEQNTPLGQRIAAFMQKFGRSR
ncbi:MAG TPA: adenylate/guanylate cyclase domain-containing protein [Oscillatoriales cyanobacterium M59_W2019_021]|nr:adenylate/guanylate cyclase domain-containing protein [Oscillatoriales cyanobacterium M4454_W2019_049]HIK52005.1 adenylate/guanylate cyclase domain-containing protein [Oscillatoriales cyanobacterium M59_W2019_021]